MSDKYLDDYLSVVAIDVAVEEKTRIARMAVATLHKLHNMMQQMRDWRDDSAKLKSNIWRMKMALRADDKNGNESQQIDPLIMHQRTEINQLEQANDVLENEVTSLKQTLAKAEEDIARIAVRELGDKFATLESEFACERERMNNEILRLKKRLQEAEESEMCIALRDKLDELARSDQTIEIIFASAISRTVEMIIGLSKELVNVSKNLYNFKTRNRNLRLKLDRLRAMLRTRCGDSVGYRKRIGELNNLAEQLMGEVGRLKVIRGNANYSGSSGAADIPDVVRHVGRLMNDLRNNLKSDREAMIAAGDPNYLKYMKKVVNLRVNLKMLSVELKRSHVPIGELCENVQHEKCLETASSLNDFLQKIDSEIETLKIRPMIKYCRIGGVSGSRYMKKVTELEDIVRKSIAIIAVLKQTPSEVASTDEKITETLEDMIERLCCKTKELEIFDDRTNLREQIEQLEASIVYLKSELLSKNERVSALEDERAGIRSTFERDRDKYEKIIANVREMNETLGEDMKRGRREILELSLKCDRSEQRVAEMQLQMRVEIDAAEKELRDLRDDKGTLLEETKKLRSALGEIESIIIQGDALKAALRTEIEDLTTKLEITSDENVKLRSIIEGLEKRPSKLKSSGTECGGEGRDNDKGRRARDLGDELEPKVSPSEMDERIGHLECASDGVLGAGTGSEISDFKPNEQSLAYRSNARTGAGEEAESDKASENKVKQLEKVQLEEELSELRSEKESLARSVLDANNKYAALQDQVNKFKSERDDLRERLDEHEAAMKNLKFELGRAATDLDTLSLRSAETEDRARMLLTERNELDDKNVALREQLNKAKEENEYFSMELNRSRVENDGAMAENARLRTTCDTWVKERDVARKRVNEIGNKCKALDNQLRSQRMRYQALRLAAAALHDESNDHENYLKEIDTRRSPAKGRKGIERKQNCSDAARTGIKVEIDERRNGGAEVKVGSDTRVGCDNKAAIRDELKRPRSGNKALKLERANLRHQNSVVTKLAEGRFENPTVVPDDEEVVGSVSKKFKIASIWYERGMSNYSNCSEGIDERTAAFDIDRLTENGAPKTKADIPRGSCDFCPTDDCEKMKVDFARATEEIQALKLELMNLRDEKAALRSQLEIFKGELNALKSERVALKDELVASRKSNFDLRLKVNDLYGANEKLKVINTELEDRLQDASIGNERATKSDKGLNNNFESALNDHLKKYIFEERNLRTINRRNRLDRVSPTNPRLRSVKENLQHIEGQKF